MGTSTYDVRKINVHNLKYYLNISEKDFGSCRIECTGQCIFELEIEQKVWRGKMCGTVSHSDQLKVTKSGHDGTYNVLDYIENIMEEL